MSFFREKYEQWIQANYSIHQVGQTSWQYRPTTELAKRLEKLKFITSVFFLVTNVILALLLPLSISIAVLWPSLRLAVAERLFISQSWIWPLLVTTAAGVGINIPIFALQEPIPPNQRYKYRSLLSLLTKRLFSKNRGLFPIKYVRVNFAGFIVPMALALYQLRFSSPIIIGMMTTVIGVTSYVLTGVMMKRSQYNAGNLQASMDNMASAFSQEPSREDFDNITSTIAGAFKSSAEATSLGMLSLLIRIVLLSITLSLLPQSLVGTHAVSIAFSSFALSGIITVTLQQTRLLLSWRSGPENPVKKPNLLIGGTITLPGYIICAFLSAEWIPRAVNFFL